MPYSLDTVHQTIERVLDKRIPKAKLQAELDRVIWEPELDRMIAVSDSLMDLNSSNRYGLFEGMTERGEYQISTGRWKYARALTTDEIAKCY